jgi:hypothetical protein
MIKIINSFIFLLLSLNSNADNIFHWKWEVVNNQIRLTGNLNNEKVTILYCEATTLKKRFAVLYRIIDEIEYQHSGLYLKTVDTLSNQLVNPFIADIEKSKSVIVEIDSSLLNFPIEFLNFRNSSVALFRPLVFKINNIPQADGADTLTLHKGYIIRDPTSDPENACKNIYHYYPGSEFKSAYKIHENDLGFKNNIDFILISAHGDADSVTFRGGIALNKIDNVKPCFFKVNNPKIVYIDACQQGINWAYIAVLAETAETNFYLGPIISNDSGESSTKTINWFFHHLDKTHNPVISLWQTRKQLYNHYNNKIKKMDVINKSFIFRVYKI